MRGDQMRTVMILDTENNTIKMRRVFGISPTALRVDEDDENCIDVGAMIGASVRDWTMWMDGGSLTFEESTK